MSGERKKKRKNVTLEKEKLTRVGRGGNQSRSLCDVARETGQKSRTEKKVYGPYSGGKFLEEKT